jgi:hypothetical protein
MMNLEPTDMLFGLSQGDWVNLRRHNIQWTILPEGMIEVTDRQGNKGVGETMGRALTRLPYWVFS